MTAALIDALKDKSREAAELLRLLGNPNRLLILCHLTQGERSVADLETDLELRQPALSQQLAELRQNGLVTTRRESRSIFYAIADDRTLAIMTMLYRIFCGDAASFAAEAAPKPKTTEAYQGDTANFARVNRIA
jgi:DNA-binding transcriptional ArsR family regulator